MPRTLDDSGNFPPPPSRDDSVLVLERAWNHQIFTDEVAAELKSKIKGNTDCFTRMDVIPLYKKSEYGYYRVVIYIRDYLSESFISKDMIWRTYSVEVGLRDGHIFSTDPPLAGVV